MVFLISLSPGGSVTLLIAFCTQFDFYSVDRLVMLTVIQGNFGAEEILFVTMLFCDTDKI
jgi:hypothetical protein